MRITFFDSAPPPLMPIPFSLLANETEAATAVAVTVLVLVAETSTTSAAPTAEFSTWAVTAFAMRLSAIDTPTAIPAE